MWLERLTWKGAKTFFEKQNILAVLPMGSVEQHGPGCPLGTDYALAWEMAKSIEEKNPDDVLLLPPVPFGVCNYHMGFAGTVDVGVDAFYAYVRGVVQSLLRHGIRKFLFVNGHGGNGSALDRVALEISEAKGLAVVYEWWTVLWSVASDMLPSRWGHGDAAEISLMLHIRPGCVDPSMKLENTVSHLSETLRSDYVGNVAFKGASMRMPRPVKDIVANGYCPGTDEELQASEKLGGEMYKKADEYINEFVVEFLKIPLE